MAIMKDVAKLAGVSVSTVSFVLNGTAKKHKVADRTAQKVLQAAKELGYKINSSLSDTSEVREWQPTIAFFTPVESTWIDMNVVYSGINKHIKQTGRNYNILLCPYETGHLIERARQIQMPAYDAAVISMMGEDDLNDLEDQNVSVPLVLYNHFSHKYSSVLSLPDEAITQAVKMIVAKEYSQILVLSGNDSWKPGDDDLNKLIKVCKKNGIELSEDVFIETENTMMGGAIAARMILNMEKKPELIICMSTSLAFGAIPLLARNEFLIPRDSELLCFGSSGEGEHIMNYIPSLSMIARPIDEITIKAFDIALHLASEREMKPIQYNYSCDLLLHNSFSL